MNGARASGASNTPALLLDAAENMFADKGFAAATLDDIAYAAGYTKGTVYPHFATKQALFRAVSDRCWRGFFDTFAQMLSAATEVGAREPDDVDLYRPMIDMYVSAIKIP